MAHAEPTSVQFWTWFSSNAERLRHDFADAEEPDETFLLIERIREQLHRYDERLFPLIGYDDDDTPELIITAEGDAHAFLSVFELMKAAPKFDDWRIVPLKPRIGTCEGFRSIEVDGEELTLDDTRFVIASNGTEVELAILVDDYADEAEDRFRYMALTLVECLIGERDLATRVNALDVIRLSDFRKAAGHEGWPIRDLASAIPPLTLH